VATFVALLIYVAAPLGYEIPGGASPIPEHLAQPTRLASNTGGVEGVGMSSEKRALVALLCVCSQILLAAQTASSLPRGHEARIYKRDLNFPVDMAWIKGTETIFFTEKASGKIRVLTGRRLLARACADLDVNSSGERGTLGIVLDPRFRSNRFLYVYYTNRSPLQNRVTRFEVRRNRCRRPRHIIHIPSPSTIHQGGQLEFMHGKLFVTVGDGGNAGNAQSLDTRLGKILRYNRNGSIPRGNPFSRPGHRSPIWSYGHRNPFGLDRRPGTSKLYSSENGPHCDDEINLIVKGRNYGWGDGYTCGTAGVGSNPKPPLFRWSNPVAPTDVTWYEGELRALSGSLYVGDFNNHRLHRFIFNRRGTRVRRHRAVYQSCCQISDVMEGPGGYLYFSTLATIRRIVRR
jgi:glucose/arabinose dehydrogenase